jgi:hypothetical protein
VQGQGRRHATLPGQRLLQDEVSARRLTHAPSHAEEAEERSVPSRSTYKYQPRAVKPDRRSCGLRAGRQRRREAVAQAQRIPEGDRPADGIRAVDPRSRRPHLGRAGRRWNGITTASPDGNVASNEVEVASNKVGVASKVVDVAEAIVPYTCRFVAVPPLHCKFVWCGASSGEGQVSFSPPRRRLARASRRKRIPSGRSNAWSRLSPSSSSCCACDAIVLPTIGCC